MRQRAWAHGSALLPCAKKVPTEGAGQGAGKGAKKSAGKGVKKGVGKARK